MISSKVRRDASSDYAASEATSTISESPAMTTLKIDNLAGTLATVVSVNGNFFP